MNKYLILFLNILIITSTIIETTNGRIRGIIQNNHKKFLGIPYAGII
jgi:hypothetical protein